jgi:hypothetical protein
MTESFIRAKGSSIVGRLLDKTLNMHVIFTWRCAGPSGSCTAFVDIRFLCYLALEGEHGTFACTM